MQKKHERHWLPALIGLPFAGWSLRRRGARTGDPETGSKPWLGRREWASPTILSGARTTVRMLWVMTVIWNLFAWPLLFLLPEMLSDGEYGGLFILLFPLVGLGLLYGAVKSTRVWRRVGPTPLTLDPYPGAIGGHIGGTIEISVPHDPGRRYQIKVSCLYSYMSGSGKNRSRHQRVVWQETGFASAVATVQGTRLRFRFAVPEQLPPSEPPGNNYHLWKVRLSTELDGLKLERSFEIPVFATGEQSRFIDQDAVDHLHAQEHRESLLDAVVQVRQVAGGVELFHPAGRRAGGKLVFLFFCLAVAAGGYGLSLLDDSPAFFVWLLGGLGALGVVLCIYLLGNSLWVRIDSRGLESRRRLFGAPLRHRQLPRSQLTGFGFRSNLQTGTGSDLQEFFQVLAVTANERRLVVAEGIEGEATARELAQNLAALTGLQALGRVARVAPRRRQ